MFKSIQRMLAKRKDLKVFKSQIVNLQLEIVCLGAAKAIVLDVYPPALEPFSADKDLANRLDGCISVRVQEIQFLREIIADLNTPFNLAH